MTANYDWFIVTDKHGRPLVRKLEINQAVCPKCKGPRDQNEGVCKECLRESINELSLTL